MALTPAAGRVEAANTRNRPRRSRRGYAWLITGLLTAFMMINFADKAVLGLAAKPIMRDLDLSTSRYGLISSGFFFLFSVAALLVGFLTNRVATRWVVLAMALVWALTQLPMLASAGFGVVLASRIVLGASEGPAFPVANHAVQKWFPNADRNLPAAVLITGAPLGVVIGAPALTWVIVHLGWRYAFGLLAAIGLAWCVAWLYVGRDGTGDAEPAAGVPSAPADPRLPYARILLSGTWLGCVIAGFAAYWAVALLVAWLPPYLETQLGYGPASAAGLVTLTWAFGALSQLGLGFVADRLMRRGVSSRIARGILGGSCVVIAGLAMAGVALSAPGPFKLVCIVVGFNFGAMVVSVSQTVCAEISPPRQRGGVLGAYAAIYAVSGVIAPYLTGRLIDTAGPASGYRISFLLCAALMIACGVIGMLFVRPERDARRLARYAAAVPGNQIRKEAS